MRVITRKSKAALTAADWKLQYCTPDGAWRYGPDKENKYTALVALGPHPDPDHVNAVIGNSSWTDCRCSECQKYSEVVVQVGQEPDYESATAWLCLNCLAKAAEIVDLYEAD